MAPLDNTSSPATPSLEHGAMVEYWAMVEAIMGGVVRMRQGGEKWLPRFRTETTEQYNWRRETAPFTNIYSDILQNLTSRPFARQVQLSKDAPEALAGRVVEDDLRTGGLVDDIDGQGHNLHVFLSQCMHSGVHRATHWIMVDYTHAPPGLRPRSRAEEQSLNLRPYWVHIPANRVLAAYWERIRGVRTLVYVRVLEEFYERDGDYGERLVRQVRISERVPSADGADPWGRAVWRVMRQLEPSPGSVKMEWVLHESGDYSIGVIPLVRFTTDPQSTGLTAHPPLQTIANMQIEEYQQESNLKEIKHLTAYPMLVGEGVPSVDGNGVPIKVPVGPRAVLFTPPNQDGEHGTWRFIEPTAESLVFLKTEIELIRKEMRDLGMQPLTTANLTVVTTANVSLRASSAVQAWAILLEDAANQALAFTSMWLGIPDTTTCYIHKDLGIESLQDTDTKDLLEAALAGVISYETYWTEMVRRGKLSPDFDQKAERRRLEETMEQRALLNQGQDPTEGGL